MSNLLKMLGLSLGSLGSTLQTTPLLCLSGEMINKRRRTARMRALRAADAIAGACGPGAAHPRPCAGEARAAGFSVNEESPGKFKGAEKS